ncbi:hypothetical protein QP943_03020 [Corynebacterium kefirresidentii]|uniref:hypothetical protein n=1 Tax=Corynebacterium sp. MSK163 TaxID=3377091 RepID=UPI0025506724|nr:hypothetical protein [Corynebacterium kefirresidentii]MDK8599173.1 hypothetical protein [Corynebacterium kefirresidentii]
MGDVKLMPVSFDALVSGVKVTVFDGAVSVSVDGVARLDGDDVQALVDSLSTANRFAELGI